MLRVGVDMIEVARVERALSRHEGRFLQRFFHGAGMPYLRRECHEARCALRGKRGCVESAGDGDR